MLQPTLVGLSAGHFLGLTITNASVYCTVAKCWTDGTRECRSTYLLRYKVSLSIFLCPSYDNFLPLYLFDIPVVETFYAASRSTKIICSDGGRLKLITMVNDIPDGAEFRHWYLRQFAHNNLWTLYSYKYDKGLFNFCNYSTFEANVNILIRSKMYCRTKINVKKVSCLCGPAVAGIVLNDPFQLKCNKLM